MYNVIKFFYFIICFLRVKMRKVWFVVEGYFYIFILICKVKYDLEEEVEKCCWRVNEF